MSRKDHSFSELYDYIKKGMEGEYTHPNAFCHNFYNGFDDREQILKGYHENVKNLQKRKNGNNLYHEIISVKVNQKISRHRHYEALHNITSDYIKMRADKCLVIGGIHDEHDHHIHMHLMISSNELGSKKRLRLTKKDFSTVKKLTEEKALALHPELAQEVLINAKKKTNSISNKEDALKRRTKKPSIKDQFKDKLKDIFDQSIDKADFFNNLVKESIEIYTRGKTIGFLDIDNNRKHRLKTLGLESEFEAINSKLSKQETEAKEKPKTKNEPKQAEVKKAKVKNQPENIIEPKVNNKHKKQPSDQQKDQAKNEPEQVQKEPVVKEPVKEDKIQKAKEQIKATRQATQKQSDSNEKKKS
jgi:hypothetical protein